MKTSAKKRCTILLAVSLMLCFLSVPVAGAIEYLGDICWNVTWTENAAGAMTPVNLLFKAGVTHTGGGHYLLQGSTVDANSNVTATIGTAELVGNTLYVTTTNSNSISPTNRDTRITHWELNASTLNGTVWRTTTDFNTSTRATTTGYNAGTITLVTCP